MAQKVFGEMKITICVHNLANGGAEHVAALWADGFAESGNNVTVILSEKNASIEYPLSSKVKLENVYTGGNALTRYFKKIRNLRKILQHEQPDFALAVLKPWSEWLLLATIGMKTRVINTEHDSFERPESAPMNLETKIRKFWLNKLFPAVTVLTDADRNVIGKRLRNVYVMPNPLAFNPYYNLEKKEMVGLAAGRLDQWHVKGFDLLINAWGKVVPNHPGWKLRIAGRGSEKDECRIIKWAKDNGVQDSVELLGFCSDLKSECAKAEIFVLSSRYEGFGMVLIEAMSQGCAPVAADYLGRASEIITSKNEGITCPVDDSDALAKSIKKLIEDKPYRLQVQKHACERSEYYSLKDTIMRWQIIFDEIL